MRANSAHRPLCRNSKKMNATTNDGGVAEEASRRPEYDDKQRQVHEVFWSRKEQRKFETRFRARNAKQMKNQHAKMAL